MFILECPHRGLGKTKHDKSYLHMCLGIAGIYLQGSYLKGSTYMDRHFYLGHLYAIMTSHGIRWNYSHFPWVIGFCAIRPCSVYLYTEHQRSWGGVYWYHLVRLSVCPSVRPSVRPSVCPSVRLWTESCPLCIFNFGKFFKFITLTLSSFDLGSNMTQWYG